TGRCGSAPSSRTWDTSSRPQAWRGWPSRGSPLTTRGSPPTATSPSRTPAFPSTNGTFPGRPPRRPRARPRAKRRWLARGAPFGFGGTNAHAVLSSVPVQQRSRSSSRSAKACATSLSVWTVSARSKDALKEAALRDAEFLQRLAQGAGESDGAPVLGDYADTV